MRKCRKGRERHYPVPHEPFNMWLCVNAQKGQKPIEVEVIQKNPCKTKIRALTETPLAGRGRTIQAGETAMVPNWQLHKVPVEFAPAKRAAPEYGHWRITVLTFTQGRQKRYYRARAQSTAREQANKVLDVRHILQMEACSQEEYEQHHQFRNQAAAR